METLSLPTRSLYYGTPVALVVSTNDDGTHNVMPMSSSWSLREHVVIGLGSQSQTADNVRTRGTFTLNLPDASLWWQVEALSGTTGRADVPAHKATQFRSEADKWHAAGLTAAASTQVAAPRIAECPLQLEAEVMHLNDVDDEPEGILVVTARVLACHAHASIVDANGTVDPARWRPLIFNFRSYQAIGETVGRMERQVRK